MDARLVTKNKKIKTRNIFEVSKETFNNFLNVFENLIAIHLYVFLNYFITFSVFPAISLKPTSL